ncbi:MAG: amino acid/amide transporter rane protein 2, family / amino acid/amide transporter [Solirubrobacterales bacterium]|nr:amino acid/amide transporter rane protein 2, family / amino acid/amide transporter [Solirubrobacterales bacterium]
MTPVLEARGVSAGYGGSAVVRDLNLTVEAGEVVTILGPNGAGKTTSLLTLAGALAPIAGEVRLQGRLDRSSLEHRARRGMSLVTDDRSVFFGLTARQNIRLGRGSEEDVLAEFPELAPHLDTAGGLLSGGQQQMLSVGRALASTPTLFLADELSLGLAPLVVQRLFKAVRAAADRGAAVLIVEQHAHLALDVADRAYMLVNGVVVRSDTAQAFTQDLADLERAYLATPSA